MDNFKWNFWRKRRTYIGESGSSVIDYVITNDKAREEVEIMTEGERTESDHTPLEIELIGSKGISRKKEKKTEMEIERSDWTEEGIKVSRRNVQAGGALGMEQKISGKK